MTAADAALERVRGATHWALINGGSLATVRADVERLSAAGARGVFAPQVFAPPWAMLGAAAACSDLELASGIAMAFVRSPLETAMAALDLDRLSGGRFSLGLGSSVRDWTEGRFGVPSSRPVARLRELVALIRQMVDPEGQAGIGRFEGDFYSIDLRGTRLPRPTRPRLPVLVAPMRAAMTEMAAEVSDGIIGHPVWTPSWIRGQVKDAVDRGLAKAGRQRSELRITAWMRVAITEDIDQGRRDAKVGLPFYIAQPQYESYFDDLGLGDDVRRVREAAAAGAGPADLAASVSDAVADELLLIGPPDVVAARLAPVLDVVDDLCLAPPNGLPSAATRVYEDAIHAHLLPGSA